MISVSSGISIKRSESGRSRKASSKENIPIRNNPSARLGRPMTAFAKDSYMGRPVNEEAIFAGAIDFLEKPFRPIEQGGLSDVGDSGRDKELETLRAELGRAGGLFPPALQRVQLRVSRSRLLTMALKIGRCALQLFLLHLDSCPSWPPQVRQ